MTSVLAMAQAQAEPATAPASSAAPSAQAASVEKIVVTGKKDAVPKPVLEKRPTTTETKGIDEIEKTVNVINTEDAHRYFPSTFARKRHIGDTQAPITTRTSGVGASARSLIYADGVLLSALIANNNSIGSPKWGMVSPEEIARIDVMYGPFSAAFAGNSIGSVVEITTRMPDGFEGSLNAVGSLQDFRQYATKDTYGAHQFSGTIGDRFGDVAFWLGASATDSDSQPLTYVTANRPALPSLAGTVLTGAFNTLNRTGAPIVVTGAGGFEHQKQDNVKLKVSWDVTPETTIAYSLGRFGNDTESTVESYLRNGVGTTIYSGGPFNINGYAYPSIAASAFSNNVYTYNETQWMHALVVNHEGKGNLDWRIAASLYDYDESVQRIPSTALPIAFSGGPGSITRLDGTGWSNIDLKGIFRPEGVSGDHEISFGYHFDRYDLENHRYNTSDWRVGTEGALASAAEGKTRTSALWLQDAWHLGPQLLLTAGLRAENWKAYDGVNYSLSPALNVRQPELNASKVSPKASLQVDIAPGWVAQASFGHAYRFPTVSELYQSVTTGVTLTVPNPNLRPEDDVSTEVSVRHEFQKGNVRLSVFTEDIRDALISQTAPLVPASPTLFNYVQNIDKVRSSGVEVVATRNDLFFEGLSVTGSMTFVDSQIVADAAFPAAVNKRTPQVPQWRSTVVATYQPDDKWTFTLAGRYSDRVYATIDNSDPVTHTYQGFDSFLVFDARVNYDIDDHWRAAAGVENLGKDDYILFHSFPQRTATAELQYRF
jgi:iron complex outermembrane receptor protein